MRLARLLSLNVLLLCGCTVGPKYNEPTLPSSAPDAWHYAIEGEFTQGSPVSQKWWLLFNDSVLSDLIEEAEQNNVSLQLATSALLQARAAYGIAAAEYSPTILAKGSVEREQASDNSPGLENFPNLNSPVVNDFTVGVDASWEVDLWGGIAKNIEAASATYEAELEQFRDVLITVRSEIASSYINVRMLQTKQVLTKKYVDSLQEFLTLVKSQYSQGVITRVQLLQELSVYDQGKALLPAVAMELAQEYARLAVLLGIDYASVLERISPWAPIPQASPNVAVGIPADVVRKRPDIRQAERELAAQTALVGSKMSDLYPKLSLSGSFGYESTDSDDLIRWSSRTWSVGPSVSWDIFNGNRIKSQIQLQEEKTNAAYLNWELVVLQAFAEVETALSNVISTGKMKDAYHDASSALVENLALTEEQYQLGVLQKIDVNQAEQNLIDSQIALVEQASLVSQNLVSLYKALGGAWEEGPKPDVSPPPSILANEQVRSEK